MKNGILAIATAATIALGTVAAPTDAEAGRRGGAVAAGIIGGLAAGAIIGGAIAAPRYYGPGPYYGGGYYYEPAPAYYAPPPAYYGPPCYWQRQRFWDGYGWRVRRVQVCY
jgi:hypothetical protein